MDEQRAAGGLLAEDGVGRGGDGTEETAMRTGVDGKAVERNRGGSGGVGARTASALGRLLAKIDVRKIGKGAEPRRRRRGGGASWWLSAVGHECWGG